MYINTITLQYPLSEQDIRAAMPNTSFPFPFPCPDDYAVVFPAPQPAYNTVTEYAKEIAPVLTSKGTWEQQWEVAPRFTEYTDENGVVHTVAEQEAAATAADQIAKNASVKASIIQQTQARLDVFAMTRNYDNILSACSYSTSPTLKFSTEGQYCVAQRDATWAKLLEIMDEVTAGTRPVPSGYAEIEPELPPLVWPN